MLQSLHHRFRIVLMPAILFALAAGLYLTYHTASTETTLAYDQALLATATDFATGLKPEPDGARFELPTQVVELLGSDELDRTRFAIHDREGNWVAGDRDLPRVPELASPDDLHDQPSVIVDSGQGPMSVLTVPFDIAGRIYTVTVAETDNKRSAMDQRIRLSLTIPATVLALLSFLGAWIAAHNTFTPLRRFEREIAGRDPENLTPIPLDRVPQEVRPLVVSLNDLLQRVQAGIELRQRFIETAAHQIRTPIAGLMLQVELAQKLRDAESIDTLHEQVERLARMTNQMLLMARAERDNGVSMSHDVDLESVARHRADNWVCQAANARIEMAFDLKSAVVRGNSVLLEEVMENLVGNAIHYAGPGTQIAVATGPSSVAPSAESAHDPATSATSTASTTSAGQAGQAGPDSMVELRVDDSGPGIAPADRDLAFDRFQRLDIDKRNPLGSGLGLSIVRELVARHGGSVELRDSPLGGLGVTVRMPAAGDGAG